ncbi:hypothetical protein [Fibrobacter sp.]|uniref:hypothetical protein n=1 Tax=Fibrobacter sp. TaxID=35828 RepID=UPI00388D2022
MKLEIGPRSNLRINDAMIIWPNFEGRPGQYNREGERSFSLIIPTEEMKDMLVNDVNKYGAGWNVRIRPPREEGDTPFMHLPVKVLFNDRGPKVYLDNGFNVRELDEDTVGLLDKIEIRSVDMDIRPYDNVIRDKAYRTAYLKGIWVYQEVNRFASRYEMEAEEDALAEMESPQE